VLPWAELIAPILAFAAGLPAVTLALLLWRRTKDRSFELLATGLGLLAILAFLLSVGIFLSAARVVSNPSLRFVLWNTTFLLSFVSLVVLRRFTSLVIPGPQAVRTFPRGFAALSALFYGVVLVLAFALTPPVVDFEGRGVYLVSALYYGAGFLGPAYRLWRARSSVPSWVSRLLVRGPWVLGPPAVALLVYEVLRWTRILGGDWPSLGSLVALAFFALVAGELFGILAPGSGTQPVEATAGTEDGSERVRRIAGRCVADPLTKRELEVLGLLLDGWRNQDIAERLGLSPSTVKNHVYAVYQKTGAANRIELVGMGE
jgi:DNA-binding CsgD family transcriptional regulator